MITPRQFEEQMNEIANDLQAREVKKERMIKLMMDALETQGYVAGLRIYEKLIEN